MSSQARKLLKAALKLSPGERAAVASSLLRSLDEEVDSGTESAWAAEITRRVKDIDEGNVKLTPWATVRRRIYRKLASVRHGRRG